VAASVYDVRYPAATASNRAVVVVDLASKATVLLPATRRVGSIALSPKGDYVPVFEVAPSSKMPSWRDLLVWEKSAPSTRYDVYATVYSAGGLVACTRELAPRLPSPVVNATWRA